MSVKRIDITSDIQCPFCLIGVKQLLNTLEKYKTDHPESSEHQIRLLPYQLDPCLTHEPSSRLDYYKKKFGEEKAKQITSAMGARLESLGYKSDYGGTVSSTHLAHRIQTYALLKNPSKQLPLAMDIFEGFNGYKKDPSDKQWLSSLAVKHSVFENEQQATQWLEGNECDEQVRQSYMIAKKLGVTGVPFFVFQGQYAASGAMGEEEFYKLLEEIDKRESTPKQDSPAIIAQGEACQTDGVCGKA
ncbi:hypothetical protein L486_01362 [Kwoniella mangroviensis CBS 10435]|uniref:DSBA-like thioredoxin domain-containing protein n=1 Tax=Kwoniella mangroviensis CBS 10435 TaxID=1331196 RepID=A0A1B9J1P3_9TREE|nr:uncharacterized protein I203_03974 [Kwoniella mangroviensis CBS 8507]OCF61702.1 hypothetical protein L486_01362 [Kwoniella mangroviensis CBS 10435]OCF67286.1 hypothetical protein I203_03974 [Kwoniella mangroviensis CBS 8507]OCF77721.1 hypothetical protein I204_01721 [Kwoniella mangroviensis CBS 8886]